MHLFFACHGAVASLRLAPAHSQLQLVVQIYACCYLALIVGLLACAAVSPVVRWLRGDTPPGAAAGKVTPDERGSTIDDWWERLGGE